VAGEISQLLKLAMVRALREGAGERPWALRTEANRGGPSRFSHGSFKDLVSNFFVAV
jgi:hypothetical protein